MNAQRNANWYLKNVALCLAAPFIGLCFIAAGPFIGIAALAWIGARTLVKSSAPTETEMKSTSYELSAEQLQSVSGGGRGGRIYRDFRNGSENSTDLASALLGGGPGVNPSVL